MTEPSAGDDLRRAGVVLAGGRSTRFGDADKALAPLAGTPMARRVADRLAGVTDELVVNCRADQRTGLEAAIAGYPNPIQWAVDDEPDRGPMAGIAAGCRATDAEYAAVVACDMPFVDPGFLAHLFERAAGHAAAVPRLSDGWFQTTQAVYRADPMAAACADALARGERRIVVPLEALDQVVVDESEVRRHAANGTGTFENVNTRAEFETATERLLEEE